MTLPTHTDLSVDQVVALLAHWNLDKEMATESVCTVVFVLLFRGSSAALFPFNFN